MLEEVEYQYLPKITLPSVSMENVPLECPMVAAVRGRGRRNGSGIIHWLKSVNHSASSIDNENMILGILVPLMTSKQTNCQQSSLMHFV